VKLEQEFATGSWRERVDPRYVNSRGEYLPPYVVDRLKEEGIDPLEYVRW